MEAGWERWEASQCSQVAGIVDFREMGQGPKHAPLVGQSGPEMSEPTDGGAKPTVLSLDMEIEKGKEKWQAFDSHPGKDGEGTSGTNK